MFFQRHWGHKLQKRIGHGLFFEDLLLQNAVFQFCHPAFRFHLEVEAVLKEFEILAFDSLYYTTIWDEYDMYMLKLGILEKTNGCLAAKILFLQMKKRLQKYYILI